MIKKKILALGISAAAVTAVVGAGVAGWTFTSEAKGAQNLGVNITAAYSFGTVAIATDAPDTVVLDQGTIASTTDGITLEKGGTASTDIVATWTVNTESYNDAKAGLTYAVNVYINADLAAYVGCNSLTGTTVSDTESAYNGYTKYTYTPTTAEATINATDATKSDIVITATPVLVYTDKPTTFAEYEAMVKAVAKAATVENDKNYTVAATSNPVVIEFVITKATA